MSQAASSPAPSAQDTAADGTGGRSVVESAQDLGYPVGAMTAAGIVELVCLVLYVVPRTRVLGVVLLTGYLGGAVAAQARVEAPLFSTLLFPVYVGLLVWAGAWATEPRVRELLPFRRPAAG